MRCYPRITLVSIIFTYNSCFFIYLFYLFYFIYVIEHIRFVLVTVYLCYVFAFVIQQLSALQDKAGNIVISSRINETIPKKGDIVDLSTYPQTGVFVKRNNNNKSTNNKVGGNICDITVNNNNCGDNNNSGDYSSSGGDIFSDTSSDSSESDNNIDNISSESSDSGSDSSDSSDNSDSSSDSGSEGLDINVPGIKRNNKNNKNNKRKRKKSKKYTRKKLKKLLKRRKGGIRTNKFCFKVAKRVLESNPRWINMIPVYKQQFGLKTSDFWKGFKEVKISQVENLLPRILIFMLKKRADAYKSSKKFIEDCRYLEKFYDKCLVYNAEDISTAAKELINLLGDGYSVKQCYQRVEHYFIRLKTVGYNNNNKKGKERSGIIKICRDFNFSSQGCTRSRCKFYSGHICVYCNQKTHGLRTCRHPALPSMVIGGLTGLPKQPK